MPSQHLKLAIAYRTDTGRVRTSNEDSVVVDAALGLALIADGMGGHNAGEVASKMVAELIKTAIAAHVATHGLASLDVAADRQKLLRNALHIANGRILAAAQNDVAYSGMGSTLVLALIRDNQLTIAYIGDSRLYRLRAGTLEQLTQDHTLVQQHLLSGLLTQEQVSEANNRHRLTRALGVMPEVAADMREEKLQAGDRYLLCSDGLSDHVPLLTMQAILSQPGVAQADQCRLLIAAANQQGGDDNISVVLINIGAGENSVWRWLQKPIDSYIKKMKREPKLPKWIN